MTGLSASFSQAPCALHAITEEGSWAPQLSGGEDMGAKKRLGIRELLDNSQGTLSARGTCYDRKCSGRADHRLSMRRAQDQPGGVSPAGVD